MIRVSRPREEILRVLSEKDYHPTAEEIFNRVRRSLPDTGIATIYRNLLKLADEGVIVKLERGMDSARYDGNTEPHAHIVCSRCGRTKDVWLSGEVLDRGEVERLAPGFRMTGYRVEFEGICADCSGSGCEGH